MTVQEAYEKLNGDYAEISSRLMTEERIIKFMNMFTRDTTFSELYEHMENRNYPEAFRAAHTLKGLCQNLAFSGLQKPVAELTECLRGGDCPEGTLDYFDEVKAQYEVVIDTIRQLSE